MTGGGADRALRLIQLELGHAARHFGSGGGGGGGGGGCDRIDKFRLVIVIVTRVAAALNKLGGHLAAVHGEMVKQRLLCVTAAHLRGRDGQERGGVDGLPRQ